MCFGFLFPLSIFPGECLLYNIMLSLSLRQALFL